MLRVPLLPLVCVSLSPLFVGSIFPMRGEVQVRFPFFVFSPVLIRLIPNLDVLPLLLTFPCALRSLGFVVLVWGMSGRWSSFRFCLDLYFAMVNLCWRPFFMLLPLCVEPLFSLLWGTNSQSEKYDHIRMN